MSLLDLLRGPDEDALPRFLETWHGPRTAPIPPLSLGPLPEPVRALAALSQCWPSVFIQNHLDEDPDWARDGDKRVFYVENQGVYLWATDGLGDDPVVWGRYNDPGQRWLAEREPLSRFLLQIVVFEAIMGADHAAAAAWIALPQVEAVLAPLERLPFGSWRWPAEPTWFYAGDQVLAFTSPNGASLDGPSDHFDVVVAATSPDHLAWLRALDGAIWDRKPS